MKIEEFRSEQKNNRAKVGATITWEDSDRPVQEIYFETNEEFVNDLTCNPHAFLVPCIMSAMRYGEERVFIDAEICPELRDGLLTAMGWIRHWYDRYSPEHKLVRIEAKVQRQILNPAKPPRAGFFFSGGIDSLATLRANRLNYPLEHPGSIKDGLLVYGLEMYRMESFEHVFRSMSAIAQDADITLIPVFTNIRDLGTDDDREFWLSFWLDEFLGAALASTAHAFSKRLSVVSINSDYDIPNQRPLGSHPLIDPNFSSSDLRIRHEGINLSRFAKTKLISDWHVGLQNLRVCNKIELYEQDKLNCGKCEKCIRTMLALLALGVLDKTTAFPADDLSEELVRSGFVFEPANVPLYQELIVPLKEKNRHDLASAIEDKLDIYYEPQWKKTMKKKINVPISRFDKKYLNGSLRKIKNFACL